MVEIFKGKERPNGVKYNPRDLDDRAQALLDANDAAGFGAVPPDAVVQSADREMLADPAKAKAWLEGRKTELQVLEGCQYFRATFLEKHQVLLLEGWRVRPLKMTKPQFW